MSMFTITIKFKRDGACVTRTEWGRRRRDAIRTLESIYGRENFTILD